jgi:raffinose/stachyose/melibiose transport system permease protein
MKISHKPKSKLYTHYFLIPAMAIFFAFFVLPNIIGLFLGFTNWSIYKINFSDVSFVGLENFKELINDPVFFISIIHTFYYTIVTVIITNVLGLFIALMLDAKLKLKSFYRNITFIPTTLSILVVAQAFKALYDPESGFVNSFLRAVGLGNLAQGWIIDPKIAMNSIIAMAIWNTLGISILLYYSGLQTVPKDYYESAGIDGCNSWQRLRKITLPLIIPTVTVNLVLSLIGGLKVFAQVFAMTDGGPNNSTQVFGTFMYGKFAVGLFGYSSAVGLIFTIVVGAFSIILLSLMRKMEVEL